MNRSASANQHRRLYNLAAWRGPGGARHKALIRDKYTCRMCGAVLSGVKGDDNAPEVDHITDHKGDIDLFLDLDNLQSLCSWPCHAVHKQRQALNGYSDLRDEDGLPIDPSHPFNRAR